MAALMPEVHAVVLDPFDNDLMRPYGRYREALLSDDAQALSELLDEIEGSYLAYRTRLTLAQHEALDAYARARHYQRALELHIDDPLARADTRLHYLRYATLAEEAGLDEEAIDAYARAIPLADAFDGLRRLVNDPYRLARIFLDAGQPRNALRALDGRAAPSLEAPAYRASEEHEKALEAYNRWLNQEPGLEEALLGRAWSLFYLGRNEEADAAFAAIDHPQAHYVRGILALRRRDIDEAVRLYRLSEDPRYLWNATELLESNGRSEQAIEVYLELARHDSRFAEHAAQRALALADRYNNAEAAEVARQRMPSFSYFAVVQGNELDLPYASNLDDVSPPEVELADKLARVNDLEAAHGELIFALRDTEDEATMVALAEALQRHGEYRQSQRAAERWLNQGSRDLRTWQLAYPRAFPDLVLENASRYNVEPALVWAVMREESRFYPQAISFANAHGLMQVIPSTWAWIAELLNETPGDSFDPADNIRYGTYYLSRLLDRFDGDPELVVPSYNGGQGYIDRLFRGDLVRGDKADFYRFIDKTETREYLPKVMLSYEVYRRLYPQYEEILASP